MVKRRDVRVIRAAKAAKRAENKRAHAIGRCSPAQLEEALRAVEGDDVVGDATLCDVNPVEDTLQTTDIASEAPLSRLSLYQDGKADVLALKQLKVLDAMTPLKIAATPLRDLAVVFDKLDHAERLERGQATSNVDIMLNVVDDMTGNRLHNNSNTVIDAEIAGEADEVDVFG